MSSSFLDITGDVLEHNKRPLVLLACFIHNAHTHTQLLFMSVSHSNPVPSLVVIQPWCNPWLSVCVRLSLLWIKECFSIIAQHFLLASCADLWVLSGSSLNVIAKRVREASVGGATFEMTCSVTTENLGEAGYSVLIQTQESLESSVKTIMTLSPDNVVQHGGATSPNRRYTVVGAEKCI